MNGADLRGDDSWTISGQLTFARAALSREQNCRSGGGDPPRDGVDALHSGARADQARHAGTRLLVELDAQRLSVCGDRRAGNGALPLGSLSVGARVPR